MGKRIKDTTSITTTLEMEVALMNHYDAKRNLIVPNLSWSMLPHEALNSMSSNPVPSNRVSAREMKCFALNGIRVFVSTND